MTNITKGNVPKLAGWRDAENQVQLDGHCTEAAIKPEIDLQSWAALGQSVKPSRTDRRQKRGWKRGGV